MFTNVKNFFTSRVNDKCVGKGGNVTSAGCRGVVVRERGGTPFRQIFWSRNGAPANIVGHRWNASG